jgi:hypothetical protein
MYLRTASALCTVVAALSGECPWYVLANGAGAARCPPRRHRRRDAGSVTRVQVGVRAKGRTLLRPKARSGAPACASCLSSGPSLVPKHPWQAWAEGLPGVLCLLGCCGMPTTTSSTSSRTWATASLGPVRRARPDWRRRAAAILFAFVGEAHPVAARTGSARRRAPADLHRPSPVRGRAERRPAPAAPRGRAEPGRRARRPSAGPLAHQWG